MSSPYRLNQFGSGWKCNLLCQVLGNQNKYDYALLWENFLCSGTVTSELQDEEDFQVLEHQKRLTGLECVKGVL